MHRAGRQDFKVQAKAQRARAVVFQRGKVDFAARDLQVAGAQIFAFNTDELWQTGPERVGALRQRQLTDRPALPTHAAIVNAAGT